MRRRLASEGQPMLDVRPGQTWERRSIPGAPWRPVRVEKVLRDSVELRYLDLPGGQVFSGSRTRMLSAVSFRASSREL